MKRFLAALGLGAAIASWWPVIRCAWRGQHNPARVRFGHVGFSAFVCLDCKKPLADYGEAGTMDGGHVTQMRGFSRENGGTSYRGSSWRERA